MLGSIAEVLQTVGVTHNYRPLPPPRFWGVLSVVARGSLSSGSLPGPQKCVNDEPKLLKKTHGHCFTHLWGSRYWLQALRFRVSHRGPGLSGQRCTNHGFRVYRP